MAATNGYSSSDETSRAWSVKQSYDAGLVIMGRKSFDSMAPYWVTATGGFAAPMNETPKAVFTQKGYKGFNPGDDKSPAAASWANAKIYDGDLAEIIRELKAESGKLIVAIAGAGFMRSLVATGLIDEYHLNTHPVFLGQGQPVFNGILQPLDLKLIDVKSFPGGIVSHIYRPA
jgi:dihydrofolate reductase